MRCYNIPHKNAKRAGIYKISFTHPQVRDDAGNILIYVGKSVNLGQRRWQHLSDLRNGTHPNPLLQELWGVGAQYFEMHLLEVVDDLESLESREVYWIDTLQPQLNVTNTRLSRRDVETIREYLPVWGIQVVCDKYGITPGYAKQIARGYRW